VVAAPLAAVLAHQGGWDEALFVAVPMAVLVGLLWLAQKRAVAEEEEGEQGGADAVVGADGGAGPEPDPRPGGR
jgi:predicted MFS family arabinose efflux permease